MITKKTKFWDIKNCIEMMKRFKEIFNEEDENYYK